MTTQLHILRNSGFVDLDFGNFGGREGCGKMQVNYPGQPRDERGRWSETGTSSGGGAAVSTKRGRAAKGKGAATGSVKRWEDITDGNKRSIAEAQMQKVIPGLELEIPPKEDVPYKHSVKYVNAAGKELYRLADEYTNDSRISNRLYGFSTSGV